MAPPLLDFEEAAALPRERNPAAASGVEGEGDAVMEAVGEGDDEAEIEAVGEVEGVEEMEAVGEVVAEAVSEPDADGVLEGEAP